jgi:hypothetical protein
MANDLEWNGGEILRLLRAGEVIAVREAARSFRDAALRFVPKDRGDLRDSHQIDAYADEEGAIGEIFTDSPYAWAHYAKPRDASQPWRHYFIGDKPSAIRSFVNGAQTARRAARLKAKAVAGLTGETAKVRKTGKGAAYLYGVAYRFALKNGYLSRAYYGGQDGLRWFDRTQDDPAIQNRVRRIFNARILELLA